MFQISTYTAVDVETPNGKNDSLCSIGIVRMEYGVVVFSKEYLVNPEDRFDEFNISIHGITPDMVKDAPCFPEVWKEISHWFEEGVVVAHSAQFDLHVICSALASYGLPIPEIHYGCTLRKSQRHIPRESCGSHRLCDLCAGLSIPLERHHDALDDARACADLFEYLIDHFGCVKEDIRHYRFSQHKRQKALTGRPLRVAAAIIRNSEGRILICRRGEGGSCAYLWEFPGGKQMQGESIEECLVRECREELGVGIAVQGRFATVYHAYPEQELLLDFFEADLTQGTPALRVHSDMAWVEASRLDAYEFCPADADIITRLKEAG